jgi:hypothetical protein
MAGREIDLVYRLLDSQLLDVDGRRCGRADDMELEGAPGEPTYLLHLLSGHGAWPPRLPRRLRRWGRKAFGAEVVGETVIRVPWSEVEGFDDTINLRRPAGELGLAQGDLRLAPAMRKLPKP